MIENTMYKVSGKDPMYKTWHTSPTHLIMYIHAGHGSIVCADKLHSMDAGLLVYIAADTYHYTMPDDPACYMRSKIFSYRKQHICLWVCIGCLYHYGLVKLVCKQCRAVLGYNVRNTHLLCHVAKEISHIGKMCVNDIGAPAVAARLSHGSFCRPDARRVYDRRRHSAAI